MPRNNVTERSDGRYTCKYGEKFFYGKTPTEAKRKRQEYVRKLDQGINPDLSDTPFLEDALGWREAFRSECNPKQQRQYDNMILYASEVLGKHYIRQIMASDIKRLYNTLQGKSQSYIQKFRTTIRGIFKSAVQDGILVRSPAEDIKPPKAKPKSHRYLEPWEQHLVVDTWREHDFGPAAMVMMFAGLRRGEALYLDVDRDVDFEEKLIRVRGAVSYSNDIHGTVTGGKNENAIRVIPLCSCLEEVLKDHHGLLLSRQDGSMMTLSSFDRKYESYITFLETKVNGCHKRWYGKTKEHKALLAEGKTLPPWKEVKIRCHDFRVTFCTTCYEAGIKIKTLQAWMGHADATMIMDIYAKLTEERELQDTTRLDDYTKSRFSA